MAELNIIKENPLTMAEMREKLEDIKKRDKELGYRGKKVEEYLSIIKKQKIKTVEALKKDLEKLDITRLKEKHIAKISDIMPLDLDSLRTIFAAEPITLKQEDLQKVLDVVKKHVS